MEHASGVVFHLRLQHVHLGHVDLSVGRDRELTAGGGPEKRNVSSVLCRHTRRDNIAEYLKSVN